MYLLTSSCQSKKMLTSKSVDLINNFVLEFFLSFSRVALKKSVPCKKRNKGTPDLESSFVFDSNYFAIFINSTFNQKIIPILLSILISEFYSFQQKVLLQL